MVPAAVLVEVDYFLRANRPAMRQFVDELFDPATTLDFQPTIEDDVVRAMELDQKFDGLEIGSSTESWRPWRSAFGSTVF